ncbi:hypothetical protein BCD67_10440 [Oscillatoriales cyanobacterium USR001]|nr:hypothetical protein BCD67_10440 [Oscillatoriales cyanobacterium USR001]
MLTQTLPLTIPLSFEAHALAQNYSERQFSPQKAKQVYLNTLAVYAVDFYLRCMEFETDLPASDSSNPLMLKLLDVADLDIKEIGKIECRPVLPNAEFCAIPPDVWHDRIGYVAVQLSESLQDATILGFTKTAASEIPLKNLQSVDDLLAYLNRLQQQKPVSLRNWFQDIFAEGWQALEEILHPEQFEWAFSRRSATLIARGQQIDLGMQLANKSVALIVTLPSEEEAEVQIKVQVHPVGGESNLPEGLKLTIIDDSEEVVLETESRESDSFIQLEFSAESGEEFGVAVSLGEAEITQHFRL